MQNIVKQIDRPIEINHSIIALDELLAAAREGQRMNLRLPAQPKPVMQAPVYVDEVKPIVAPIASASFSMCMNRTYIIKVRQYMTKPGSPEFDFQTKWNNDVPMPFRVMKGTVLKETRGMYMMSCFAVPLNTNICSRCGRALTHPVSRLYGIGPECGGHAHVNPFDTEEELYEHLNEIRQTLATITWTGWVIKSSIEEFSEVPLYDYER